MVDDEAAKQQLVNLLNSKRAILLAGAGSSCSVGYPMWAEFVDRLGKKFTPLLNWTDQSPMEFAGQIVSEIKRTDQLVDYYNFLERSFEPPNDRKLHDDFHVALVQLGFCGIVTTNYEEVIESAVMEAYNSEFGPYRCEHIDLCGERSYRVFDFLRSLATSHKPKWVLHLHGHYRNPEGIVLTLDDYKRKYGEVPIFDSTGRPQNQLLDSLHRKVLWTLLTTHSLVFVGFSLRDEFFTHILRIVQRDFGLGSDPTHFAIMSFTTDEDKDKTALYLKNHNTMPIFYHAPKDSNGIPNHSKLKDLIFDLARRVGVPDVFTGITDLNRRMLEL